MSRGTDRDRYGRPPDWRDIQGGVNATVPQICFVPISDLSGKRFVSFSHFRYADPGIRKATGSRLDVHLVRASEAPESGTGWHRHKLSFHAIYMVSGWARFMYEDKPTLVESGDFVNVPPGITHYLHDYSQDMRFLEIAMAGTPDGMIPQEPVEPLCETPAPKPWAKGSSSGIALC